MVNRRILRELLVVSYDQEELFTLATDIAGDAELVFSGGGNKETRARELVAWCGRQSKIQLLIDEIRNNRPDKYKDYENKLEDKKESPLTEAQSASEEIEDVFGALKSVEVKKEPVPSEITQPRKTRHPLAGSQTSVHAWFKKLSTHQQVFVVSAALFSGLQKDELMYLYSNALKALGMTATMTGETEEWNG